MNSARVFWIKQGPTPPSYDGIWSPPIIDNNVTHLHYIVRVLSGRPYILEGIPPNTIPLVCEGKLPDAEVVRHGTWGVPAIYTRVTESCWKGLTFGCQHKVELGSLLCVDMFAFTYEGGDNRLHLRYRGVSYPLTLRPCTWAEIDMIRAWG